jgi:hypothetical protein
MESIKIVVGLKLPFLFCLLSHEVSWVFVHKTDVAARSCDKFVSARAKIMLVDEELLMLE